MHQFATDSLERRNITASIAILTIPLAFIINELPRQLGYSIPWWFDYPSVLGLFFLMYEIFNKSLWKWEVFKAFGLVKVPDLNGKWNGTLNTSYDGYKLNRTVTASITQSWTEMIMYLETNQSRSYTLTSAILVNQPNGITLSYEYFDEPITTAPETMHSHRGSGILKLNVNNLELKGEYYTGRDRMTNGSIFLRRCT